MRFIYCDSIYLLDDGKKRYENSKVAFIFLNIADDFYAEKQYSFITSATTY